MREPIAEPVLSAREVELLQLFCDGLSSTEVAERLYISAKTVKNHLASIYDKLGARDRTEAVVKGVRAGLVQVR
jgi:two-component system, NarL family, response regulator DegU